MVIMRIRHRRLQRFVWYDTEDRGSRGCCLRFLCCKRFGERNWGLRKRDEGGFCGLCCFIFYLSAVLPVRGEFDNVPVFGYAPLACRRLRYGCFALRQTPL